MLRQIRVRVHYLGFPDINPADPLESVKKIVIIIIMKSVPKSHCSSVVRVQPLRHACAILQGSARSDCASLKSELHPRNHDRRLQNVPILCHKTDSSNSQRAHLPLDLHIAPLTHLLLSLQLNYSAGTRGEMATSEPRATDGEQDPNSDNLRPPSSSRSLVHLRAPHTPSYSAALLSDSLGLGGELGPL